MKTKCALCRLLVALLAVIVIAGCASRTPQKIKMAYIAQSADLAVFVAKEQGYFAAEGLDVELVKSGNSSEMMNALLAGHVDAIGPIGFATIFGVEQRSPGQIKGYMPGGESEGHVISHLIVTRDSPITSVDQLGGKKIGTYTGSTQLMNLNLFLQRAGFSPGTDVIVVQVSPDLQVKALQAGQFDALFSVDPFTTTAIAKGIGRSILDNPRSKYIVNPFVSGANVFSSRMLSDSPEVAKRIYEAFERAYDFIEAHPDEAKRLLPKYAATDLDVALKTDTYALFPLDANTLRAIQRLADLCVEYKVLERPIQVKTLFVDKASLQ